MEEHLIMFIPKGTKLRENERGTWGETNLMFHLFEYKEQTFLLEQLKAPGMQGLWRRLMPLCRAWQLPMNKSDVKMSWFIVTILRDGNR